MKKLYISLFEEVYKTAHKDNFYDYIKVCKKIKYKPLQEIKEFFENKFNEIL